MIVFEFNRPAPRASLQGEGRRLLVKAAGSLTLAYDSLKGGAAEKTVELK